MRGVVFLLLAGLFACAIGYVATSASASSELREWRTAAGTPPSKNEFAAVVAACEDRVKGSNKDGPLEACLAYYGLQRLQ